MHTRYTFASVPWHFLHIHAHLMQSSLAHYFVTSPSLPLVADFPLLPSGRFQFVFVLRDPCIGRAYFQYDGQMAGQRAIYPSDPSHIVLVPTFFSFLCRLFVPVFFSLFFGGISLKCQQDVMHTLLLLAHLASTQQSKGGTGPHTRLES